MELEWIRTYENGADYIESIGGVSWNEGAPPYPWHRCEPQTRGWIGLGYVERCCCGAIRARPRGPWADRNRTRRDRKRKRREARMPREQVTCTECGQSYEAIASSAIARERLCGQCWADELVREHAPRA
jgi:hypothetical protein